MGIEDFKFELSLRDPEDKVKYHQDDKMWDLAENKLRDVLNDLKIEYVEKVGEAAFYGPKLDVQVKPAVGNEFTLSTCQLDFCLPAKFDLTYVDADGTKKTPVVIHRAIFGSLDRTIAFYLEQTKGILPTWLAPHQARIIPVSNEHHLDYAKELNEKLINAGIRSELDSRDEKVGYRMRDSITNKIPYQIVVGDKELENKTLTYRVYGTQEQVTVSVDEFLDIINKDIDEKIRRD